jgi:hypothetical protein
MKRRAAPAQWGTRRIVTRWSPSNVTLAMFV